MRKIAFLLLILPFVLFSCGSDEPFVEVTPNGGGSGGASNTIGGTTTGGVVPDLEDGDIQLVYYHYKGNSNSFSELRVTANDLTIDWGDGSPSQKYSNLNNNLLSHENYAVGKEYNIKIKSKDISMLSMGYFESAFLGRCPSLKRISVSMLIEKNNFDISKCVNLEHLNLLGCDVEELNLNNHTKLKSLKVEKYYHTKLKKLYLGNLSQLKMANIGAYSLPENTFDGLNNLDSLDLFLLNPGKLTLSNTSVQNLKLDVRNDAEITLKNNYRLNHLSLDLYTAKLHIYENKKLEHLNINFLDESVVSVVLDNQSLLKKISLTSTANENFSIETTDLFGNLNVEYSSIIKGNQAEIFLSNKAKQTKIVFPYR